MGKEDWFWQQFKLGIRRLGLDKNVIFTGYVTDGELASFYQQASFLILPSLSEGFGLPGLEAMAAGLPVLSSNASCLPEVYGSAAEYFDPRNTDELAKKITSLLNSPERLGELRQLGLAQAKKYSWAKMAESTLAIYNRILKGRF